MQNGESFVETTIGNISFFIENFSFFNENFNFLLLNSIPPKKIWVIQILHHKMEFYIEKFIKNLNKNSNKDKNVK